MRSFPMYFYAHTDFYSPEYFSYYLSIFNLFYPKDYDHAFQLTLKHN